MLHDFADQYAILIVTGLAALVIAGIVFLFSDPGISREAAAGESEPLAPVEAEGPEYASVDRRGQRYLEIYGALAVPRRDELGPISVSVDLAYEESLGTRAASEQHAAREPDLPWPLNVRAAKARKLSR